MALHGEDLAGIGTTAAKVWESSLEQVVRSGRPLARDVLGVLSCFAPENIPRALTLPAGSGGWGVWTRR